MIAIVNGLQVEIEWPLIALPPDMRTHLTEPYQCWCGHPLSARSEESLEQSLEAHDAAVHTS